MPLTFLAPWFAIAGLLAAAGVVAAHFIGARTRAPVPLPTTRFVPRLQERSAAVERRPRDVLLMLFRAAALAFTGVGLAAPLSALRERAAVRIVIADLAGTAGGSEILGRARLAAGDNGRVVISDSAVRVVNAADVSGSSGSMGGAASLTTASLTTASLTGASLTAALMQAIREAGSLSAEGHPVELAIVSDFGQRAVDSATTAVRALWPGSVELIEVPPTGEPTLARGTVTLRGDEDDPLRGTAGLLPSGSGAPVVIVRGDWSAADSASAAQGGVVARWPRAGVPDSFTATGSDTVGGVWVAGYTLVAPMSRDAVFSGSDDARVIARWVDGRPAAVERQYGAGCVRDVAIAVPEAGDVSISPGFRRVAAALTGPCGEARSRVPLAAAERAALRGSGPREARVRAASTSVARSPLTVPLLLLALVTLLVELGVRRWRR